MKRLTSFLVTNLINVIGTAILIGTALYLVCCFAYSAFSGNDLIIHISLNN